MIAAGTNDDRSRDANDVMAGERFGKTAARVQERDDQYDKPVKSFEITYTLVSNVVSYCLSA